MNFILPFLSIKFFILVHLLLACGTLVVLSLKWILKKLNWPISFRDYVLTLRFFLITILLLPGMTHFIPQKISSDDRALYEIWAGRKMADFEYSAQGKPVLQVHQRQGERIKGTWSIPLDTLALSLLLLTLLGALPVFGRLIWARRKLSLITNESFSLKRVGRVEIRAHDEVKIPMSYKFQGRALIILPTQLLGHPREYTHAIFHELKHHRHGDTTWVYFTEVLRALLFLNPFIHLLLKEHSQAEELASDEALLGLGVSSKEYGYALLKVAQLGQETRSHLVGTASMSASPHFLKRRIEMLVLKRKTSRWISTTLALVGLGLLSSMALAAKDLGRDKRLSLEKVMIMAKKAESETGIPIVVNDEVLKWLNRGVSTERGRLYLKKVFKRMEEHKDMILGYIHQYDLPYELLAVPAHESGYQDVDNGTSSGIWAFTPDTARVYGLRVDEEVDERSDERKLTIAAMSYFTHLYKLFADWHLALLAYNSGENRLQRAISEVGTREAFELIKKSTLLKEENKNYLPKAMAMIIILKNPDMLD